MQRVIDLGYSDQVYARYNSNMSRIKFYKHNLFDDILSKFKDWQINASIDGTGEIGEYVRSGLNYKEWLANMKYGKKFMKHPRQMQLDLTVTLPGVFDLENMWDLQNELKMPLLCKKVFSFDPSVYMSPLFMPKSLLHPMIEDVQNKISDQKKNVFNIAFIEGLQDIKNHPTNDQKYDNETCAKGWKNGKGQCEKIDQRRGTDIKRILGKNKKVLEWWNDI